MSNSTFLALVGDFRALVTNPQLCRTIVRTFPCFLFFNFVQNNVGGEISNNYYPRSNGAPFAFVLESTRSQCVQPLKRFFCCNCDAFRNRFRNTRPKLLNAFLSFLILLNSMYHSRNNVDIFSH